MVSVITIRVLASTAQSTNAASASPRFEYADVDPGVIFHNGDICNQGVLCGSTPGGPSDRSLLDFTSVALDGHGCSLFTFAGNPTGAAGNNTSANTFNYVARQTGGCFASSASRHHKKKKTHHHKKHHHPAKRHATRTDPDRDGDHDARGQT